VAILGGLFFVGYGQFADYAIRFALMENSVQPWLKGSDAIALPQKQRFD
jgi:hypothetical protein